MRSAIIFNGKPGPIYWTCSKVALLCAMDNLVEGNPVKSALIKKLKYNPPRKAK